MKFSGNTDNEDWNVRTFFDMAKRRKCWSCGYTPKEWWFQYFYTWYDAPVWQVRVGPFWVCLSYLSWE